MHRRQDCESRASPVLKLVQLGEVSAGRQASEDADFVPGTPSTLAELRRRPAVQREPVMPLFNLDEILLGRNIRSARRGAAGGLCAHFSATCESCTVIDCREVFPGRDPQDDRPDH